MIDTALVGAELSDPAGMLASMQTRPIRDRDDLEAVLRTAFTHIGEVRHRLVGTAAACWQGVDLPVGDIDLLVSRRHDVDAIAQALARFPCITAPRWLPASHQYFASHSVDGVEFSVSTVETPCPEDGWECQGPGPWRHYVTVDGIDCVRLELRLTTELLRGRPDRYTPLLAHLTTHGADLELLHRSVTTRAVPETLAYLIGPVPSAPSEPPADRHQ